MTQEELAEVAGIAQSNLSAIERGRRTPSAETLHRLVTSCGYLLAAVDRPGVETLPALVGDDLPFTAAEIRADAGQTNAAALTDEERSDRLIALLNLSETIVRGR